MSGRRETPGLEPLLGELVSADAGGPEGHPQPGRLLAYHDGGLPEAEAKALQDHLAGCRACAAALLDLDAFGAAAADAPAEGAPAGLATAAAWRTLAPRLAGARGEPAAGGGPAGRAAGRVPSSPWLRAVAASLLVAVPVLGVLLLHSRGEVAALRRALAAPQAGVPILYLDSTTRDEAPDAAVLELPPGDGFFLLAVTPQGAAAAAGYRVTILDGAGRAVWRADGLAPSDHGTLRLGFTRRSLPAGRYRVEVAGGSPQEAPTVFDFVLRDPA